MLQFSYLGCKTSIKWLYCDEGDAFCYARLQNQSRSGFKNNFLADGYVQTQVYLFYIKSINILTQVLTVLQTVRGVRIAHTVTIGCATG